MQEPTLSAVTPWRCNSTQSPETRFLLTKLVDTIHEVST